MHDIAWVEIARGANVALYSRDTCLAGTSRTRAVDDRGRVNT